MSRGAERGDNQPISSDVAGGLAPSQSKGTVGQLADLQVSGAQHPHFDYRHSTDTNASERERHLPHQ